MNRTWIGSLVACVAAVGACSSERAVENNQPGTLTIVSAGDPASWDTVRVGGGIWFTVMRSDSSVPPGPWEWTVSDTTVLSIVEQRNWEIWTRGVRRGKATVTVKFNGEFGTHDVIVREMRPADTAVARIVNIADTLTVQVGDSFRFGFNVVSQFDFLANRQFTVAASDSTILQQLEIWTDGLAYGSTFRALKSGATSVNVTCGTQRHSTLVFVQ